MNRAIITRLLSLFLLFLGISIELKAQSNELDFKTDGLYYAEFYDYIFRGEFENIKITRKDGEFSMIMEQYLRSFAKRCPSYLPSNKIEIMELVCSRERVTKNGYGVEISRVCVDWVWAGTGLYAKSDLYNAKLEAQDVNSSEGLQKALDMLFDPNAFGNSVDLIHKRNGLNNDMVQFFKLNPCNSKGLLRFEENLKRFALDQPGIRMKEESKYSAMKKSGGPSGEQNYAKLFDDLIADQSRTWMMNRYTKGSISGVNVLSQDENGRPKSIKANYRYSSAFGGPYNGWAKIDFVNGLPDCIYFHDCPQNCKKSNSSIVASYAQGKYSK